MRGPATKLVVLLALGGLFCYLVLPGVIENQLARRLQEALGVPTKPDVEVSSSFPPELLLRNLLGQLPSFPFSALWEGNATRAYLSLLILTHPIAEKCMEFSEVR
jgi:hypothetical protein